MSLHKKISFVKSAIRIIGYFGGMIAFNHQIVALSAFAVLVVSEVIGIIEELGEK